MTSWWSHMTTPEAAAAYYDVLLNACRGLGRAAEALEVADRGVVRPPRPRFLQVCPGMTWPYFVKANAYHGEKAHYGALDRRAWPEAPLAADILDLHRDRDCQEAADYVIEACKMRPKLVYRALRRLQAARDWCDARAAGL